MRYLVLLAALAPLMSAEAKLPAFWKNPDFQKKFWSQAAKIPPPQPGVDKGVDQFSPLCSVRLLEIAPGPDFHSNMPTITPPKNTETPKQARVPAPPCPKGEQRVAPHQP